MTQTAHPSDHEMKLAIEDRLFQTQAVNGDRVGVAITDGVVTLSGQVMTYLEKAAAIRATVEVTGSTALVDELSVRTPWGAADDADLARTITDALQATHIRPSGPIAAEVSEGVVTLHGTVAWEHESSAIVYAIKDLPGVKDVKCGITVLPPVMSSAAEIEARITEALVGTAIADAGDISVDISGSEVTLAGLVSSHDESRRAEHAARSAPGVTDVDNRLSVKYRGLPTHAEQQ